MTNINDTSGGTERRRAKRHAILQTFSMFLVVPKKGIHRLQIHDLSDEGIGFDYDLEGEDLKESPIQTGEILDIYIYLNQSLYLPLNVEVRRIHQGDGTLTRRIGAQFTQKNSKSHMALLAFLDMLDAVSEAARIDHPA